ncbi:bifunctional RNase H/acid phosphatase [Buchananella felis]|uniref:bifunctional RNase H/acid phosphatase n=1 Tax=Buchananella felis TaxID=3231492 RepID=UPI003529120D
MTRRLLINTDGGARGNPGPAGYGAVIRDADSGELLATRAAYLGQTTNNVAEYRALLAGLLAAAEIDPEAEVEVRADSKLVVSQMTGAWKIKHADMRELATQAKAAFDPARVTYRWVPRAENSAPDALANQVMDSRGEIATDEWRELACAAALPAFARHDAPVDLRADEAATVRAAADAEVDDAAAPADASTGHAEAGGHEARAHAQTAGAREAGVATSATAQSREREPLARPNEAALWAGSGVRTTIVMVRHGVTPMTIAGEFSGGSEPGPDLTQAGREQVASSARFVARIGQDMWPDSPAPSVFLASPMTRTLTTARILAEPFGGQVEVDEDFREAHLGHWQAKTASYIEEHWPGGLEEWVTTPHVRPPGGGESLQDVYDRVIPALRRVVSEHAGKTVVIATHNVVLRAALGASLRMAGRDWRTIRTVPAAVSVIEHYSDGRLLVSALGVPPHL